MSDKLSGLPTTLDEGAMAVQRFTSANGDIEKSTDYFLALNNAILAGGAATDIQSSALEQLSQAYAKGKPDMMEWRSLMTAMPAQLKQVAIAMGYPNTDALGEALRKGEVSMDAFMNKVVELNKKGTGEFQNFEEQARNSTGGIATSITVAKTQVVKGVADIIQSIDQLLKDNGLGGIGEIISNVGKKAKELLDTVAEKLPGVLEYIKEHKDALKNLLGVIISVWTTYKAYQTTLLIIKGIQIAQAIWGTVSAFITLIPAIKSVKDAMLLLNMVFAVNPIALIIGAIAALVAAFVYFWNTSEGFRNFWIGLWEGIKNAVKTAIDFVVNIFNGIVDFVKNNWQSLLKFIVNPFAGAFELLYNNCEGFRNFVDNFANNIKKFFTETIPNAFKNLLNKILETGSKIGKFFEDLWTGIINFFTKTIPQWIQNVKDWFANLPETIRLLDWVDIWIHN